MLPIPAVAWSPDRRALRYLDQRALPSREVVCDARSLDEVIEAIRTLAVRGAPVVLHLTQYGHFEGSGQRDAGGAPGEGDAEEEPGLYGDHALWTAFVLMELGI